MDVGARIKLARVKAGLTIRDLADRVGVTPTAISKFERGEIAPRQSTLLRLAKALSVGVEFFFREVRVHTVTLAYRKHSTLGTRTQEAVEAAIVETIERYLIIEEMFPADSFPETRLPHFTINDISQVEQIAEKLREAWNLGNDAIDDLCGRLEDCGIRVIAIDGPQGFDGLACWVNDRIPAIAFNANVPGDRQRFDLAHELGHLVLDVGPDIDEEKAAYRFAGAFLVPATAVYSELGRKRSNLSLDELLLLKKEYGLSVAAWIRRAFDLEIITSGTYNTLYRRLSAAGWRAQEPEIAPKEEPRRLCLLVHRALAENFITPSFAATLLGTKGRQEAPGDWIELSEPSPDLVRKYSEDSELRAFLNIDLNSPEVQHEKD